MELSQREQQLDDREMRLSIREEELELAYQKLAVGLHQAAGQQTAEKVKVGATIHYTWFVYATIIVNWDSQENYEISIPNIS